MPAHFRICSPSALRCPRSLIESEQWLRYAVALDLNMVAAKREAVASAMDAATCPELPIDGFYAVTTCA